MKRLSRQTDGFTLVEMMIAVFVGALLIMISYNVLTTQKKVADSQNQYINTQQNARIALETLEKELRLAGLNIDDFNSQPVFIDAAPYQVIFNADISGGVSGVMGMTIDQEVPLSDGTMYHPGMNAGENIGTLERYNNNAETVRYTFDRDDNGSVGNSDKYTESANPDDYALYREENGDRKDIVAHGIRGKENYPDGQIPQPMFKYYGDFDSDGALELWGDSNADGQLSQSEIATLNAVSVNMLSKIIEVEITVEAESPVMEAGFAGPHSTSGFKRMYRSVTMTSKVRPRNIATGSANLHACGDPPAAPTSLSAADKPYDKGFSITLSFNGSYDELFGEEDIKNYTVYRKESGPDAKWECIGSVLPELQSSYVFDDDKHTMVGGPTPDKSYYYVVSAWDCRPQESGPSNTAGPVQAVPNGPSAPTVVNAFDTPCDMIDEITVSIHKSPDDQASGGSVSRYEVYRGEDAGGGTWSKMLVGTFNADASEYYDWRDNETGNVAGLPPEAGNYYYYIAVAVDDTIPSLDSNEFGGVYYSGTISACQIKGVDDYPDDDGHALVVRWDKSPSEDCGSDITHYIVKRKDLLNDFLEIATVTADHQLGYSYIDEELERGWEYTYCVYTVSTEAEQIPSNLMSGIPFANTEFEPPENLTADDILCDATGAIEVTWENAPQDIPINGSVTDYFIYRRMEFTSLQKVGEIEADGSGVYIYVDGPATNPMDPPVIGEFYYYAATAYDSEAARESVHSNEDYTMSDGEPGAPHVTQAYDTPADAGQSITVEFSRSADDGHCTNNVIIYRIYREESDMGAFSTLIGELTADGSMSYTFYDDDIYSASPPVDGIGYYYAVRAHDGEKESVNSNVVGPVYSICQEASSYTAFEDDFETNKGWEHVQVRTQDDWQRGAPMGGGGEYHGNHDPSSAYSGSCIYGNDLGGSGWNGDYKDNVENYLVTPAGAVDCSGHANVVLQFQRWLNVESPAYDQAEIHISTNGHAGPWTMIWQNPTEMTDNAWVFMEIDISQWADGETDVAIMWKLKSDGGWVYSGWNIDDVVIREHPQLP